MRILSQASELQTGGRKVCAAIGVFDGVHLGHQQILRQTIADARHQEGISVAITFDRHPNAIVAPQRVPPAIYPVMHKLRRIEELGMDAVWLIPFNEAFSRVPAENFIRELARDFHPLQSLCVGSAFTFGYRRSGDVALLQKLGKELHFIVHGLSAVALDGKVVSSTRIREAIQEGQLDAASQMLGRTHGIVGKVVAGDRLGRQLGFPTANVAAEGLALPPNGVYAAHVLRRDTLKGGHPAPEFGVHPLGCPSYAYHGAVNIGLRPTLNNPTPQLRVETHLLDFAQDIYGEELEVQLVDLIRGEQKFASLDDLKQQIARDVEAVRRVF